jgi:CRP/FNR family transcriptional regulator, cyclic AMP receptor protein
VRELLSTLFDNSEFVDMTTLRSVLPDLTSDLSSDLLSDLPPDLQLLAAQGTQRSFKKGELIFNDGDPGNGIYILLQGRMRAFGSSVSGKAITYGYIDAGEYFGELTLDGGRRSASIEAMEPSNCVMVSNAQVKTFMQDQPNFATDMLHTVISRARQSTNNARNIALLDVYSRLKHTIEKITPQIAVSVNTTHLELAADVGASREMVSKLLKDLEIGGYINLKSRKLTRLKALPVRW